jgi:hypothetical protein
MRPVPASPSMSAGTPTATQIPPGNTSLAGTTSLNSTVPNVQVSSAHSSASNPTSTAGAAGPQTGPRFPWRKVQRFCTVLAKVLFALVTFVLAYLALESAMWSSAKDYRDDCRSQTVVNMYAFRHISEIRSFSGKRGAPFSGLFEGLTRGVAEPHRSELVHLGA